MTKQSKLPLVTIIVPVYNSEKFLDSCISSILKQSHANIEAIFVNDGSSDNSLRILKSTSDHRIKIISQKNAGVSKARNAGLKEAKGDYICFVDSDDIIDEFFVESLLRIASLSSADIVCTDYINLTAGTPTPHRDCSSFECISSKAATERLLTERLSSAPHGKLFKRAIARSTVFPALSIAEDLLFNYDSFQKASLIAVSHCALYFYRLNPHGLTKKSFQPSRMDGLTAAEKVLSLENESTPAKIRTFMEAHYILESIGNQQGQHIFKEKCIKIIQKYRFTVLFSKEAKQKQRFFALLSIFSPSLPAKIVLLKRRKK